MVFCYGSPSKLTGSTQGLSQLVLKISRISLQQHYIDQAESQVQPRSLVTNSYGCSKENNYGRICKKSGIERHTV